MTGTADVAASGSKVWRVWVLHAAALFVLVVGVSPFAVLVCVASLWLRIFGITAGYHRLLSHRAYKTSRVLTFLLAWLGASSGQRGPLWWASRHREHHRFSDADGDPHSPVRGRLFAHIGWLLQGDSLVTNEKFVQDWLRFPELRWLNRFHLLPPALWGLGCFAVGAIAERAAPATGTSGAQCFVWGFIVATLASMHLVSSVNSLAHVSSLGSRAHETDDQSRNIWWLALPTLGDAWHNNHHAFPHSARHGIRAAEVDLTYLALRAMAAVHLVWDLRPPSSEVK